MAGAFFMQAHYHKRDALTTTPINAKEFTEPVYVPR
jgi:hypothetical protein